MRRVAFALVIVPALVVGACTGNRQQPAPSTPAEAPGPAVTATTAPPAAGKPASGDWPTYHRDRTRSGFDPTFPVLSGPPRVLAALKLDGAVYASPLVAAGRTIVATERDTLYAFDDLGRQLWRTNLGSPSPAHERPCGNIDPLGITGTPVYEPTSGLVFAVAELSGSVRHELVAVEAATGRLRFRRSVDLPGVDPTAMQQRGALTISGRRVWIPFGALAGDCGNYKGRLVGAGLDGGGGLVYYSPPTQRGGGMWNPAGPTVDARGQLLVVSANGAAFPGDRYDHTNSVLRLDTTARLLDSFAPSDWAENNQGDVGLGSQGVTLVGSRWVVLGGKSGPVYVLRQSSLGGIGGQVSTQNICRSFGGAAVHGNVVYLPCTDGVRAVSVSDSGQLTVLWHAADSIAGSPVLGGGRLWVLDQHRGSLHGLDPATGKSASEVDVGRVSRFATPALHAGHILVPTLAGLTIVGD